MGRKSWSVKLLKIQCKILVIEKDRFSFAALKRAGGTRIPTPQADAIAE
jgi:hypothetical protein